MFRTIIVFLIILIILVFTTPLLLFEWIVGKFNPELKSRQCRVLAISVFKLILWGCGTKITVKGRENLPDDGRGVLYIGNHRSYLDILISYIFLPSCTGFVAKIEMLKVPILRQWMKNIGCVFLDRDDIKAGLKTILEAIDLVKSGKSIFIFPEGTRNKEEGTFLPFHGGSFKISTKSKCDIIPVSIVNSAAVFENQNRIKKAHVVIEYGKPIVVSSLSVDEQKDLPELVRTQIIDMYNVNKDLL